jgi:AraC-like DNA-binding protein
VTTTATFPPPTPCSEALITKNLGLARQQAWKFHRKTGQPYDDLEAIAFVGLIRGCRRYDPERLNPGTGKPYALSTIVVPFIAGEILHHFRDRGHAIKFPSRWREQWGKVQRLMADPDLSAQEVAEQCGLSSAELSEMLGAMTGTANLDDLHGADGYEAVEPELPRIAPLQALVRQAWENLHPGDRGTLLSWWNAPRRAAHPLGPLQQFHRRLQALLQGRRLSEVLQLALAAEVPTLTAAEAKAKRLEADRQFLEAHGLLAPGEELKPARRRSRKALETAAAQLGLLVA